MHVIEGGRPAGTGRASAVRERLVGRGPLLRRVERELGSGRPVTLQGVAGVGKTRVLEALAQRHDGPVVRVDARSPDAMAAGIAPPQGDRPVLVLVDDAPLLDPATVARLRGFDGAGWCRVVTTSRFGTADDGGGRWWASEGWRHLEVAPLDLLATGERLRDVLGALVAPDLTHAVWRASGGHPVGIVELALDAKETGCIELDPDAWRLVAPLPVRRLTELVGDRFVGLGPAARLAADVLALGAPLPIDLAASLVDPAGVRELEREGLARFQDDAAGRCVVLATDMHAEVLIAGMGAERRKVLQSRLAEAYDRSGDAERRLLGRSRWRLERDGGEVDDRRGGDGLPFADDLLAGLALLADRTQPTPDRSSAARRATETAMRRGDGATGWWLAVSGWLRFESGDLGRARDRLVEALLACERSDPFELRPVLAADLASLAASTGAPAEAEGRLQQVGGDRDTSPRVAARYGIAEAMIRAQLDGDDLGAATALAAGDDAVAAGLSRDAVEAWQLAVRLGAPGAVLQRLSVAGLPPDHVDVELLRRHADHLDAGDATGLSAVARDLAAAGRYLVAAEAAAQASRLATDGTALALARGLATACPGARTPALEGIGRVELSPRRRQVGRLAMAGVEGRVIAGQLGVSLRTVENHLAHVYREAGVRGRRELRRVYRPDRGPFAAGP